MNDKNYKYCPNCNKKLHKRVYEVHVNTCQKKEKNLENYSYNELKNFLKENMEETPAGYTRMKKEELLEIARGL